MTMTAVLFMTVSVTAVVALAIWCYYEVLNPPTAGPDQDADEPDRS